MKITKLIQAKALRVGCVLEPLENGVSAEIGFKTHLFQSSERLESFLDGVHAGIDVGVYHSPPECHSFNKAVEKVVASLKPRKLADYG